MDKETIAKLEDNRKLAVWASKRCHIILREFSGKISKEAAEHMKP